MKGPWAKVLWVVPGYLAIGFALGAADPALGSLIGRIGARPGFATAVNVNLVMPLVAIGLAWASRSLGVAWLGALGMSAAYFLGLAAAHPGRHHWQIGALVEAVPPVLVVACVGYAVIGTFTVLTLRSGTGSGRRVGTERPAA